MIPQFYLFNLQLQPMETKITVHALINAPVEKVWDAYTKPEHITKWNYASSDWHSPSAVNDSILYLIKISG